MFVVTLMVDELPLVTLVGLKLAFTPAGRPLALKLTLPENPFVPVTVTLYVVLPPAVTVREVGDGLKEKSGEGGAFTTRVTAVVCVSDPLVPVIVNV